MSPSDLQLEYQAEPMDDLLLRTQKPFPKTESSVEALSNASQSPNQDIRYLDQRLSTTQDDHEHISVQGLSTLQIVERSIETVKVDVP